MRGGVCRVGGEVSVLREGASDGALPAYVQRGTEPCAMARAISARVCVQVVRSRLQQRMDARQVQYRGVLDVVRTTLRVSERCDWLLDSALAGCPLPCQA